MKISKLGDKTDEIIPKVLQTGGEVMIPKIKSNLQSVIGKNTKTKSRSTGELVTSLGLSRALKDRNGNFNIKIGFKEPRMGGESNAKIANIIEYGKSNQPSKPFLKPARSATKDSCIDAMRLKLEQEMNEL